MKAAELVNIQGQKLTLSDAEAGIQRKYEGWLDGTGDAIAAALLTLAAVIQNGPQQKSESPLMDVEFLTVKQASSKYNLGQRTIYRMVEQGMPVTRAGKAIRINPRDLQKWVAKSETILH